VAWAASPDSAQADGRGGPALSVRSWCCSASRRSFRSASQCCRSSRQLRHARNLTSGSIDFGVAAVVTLIELAGVIVGVRLAHAVDENILRKFVAILCLVGTALVIREMSGWR
jgi:hypothetical protein